MNQHHLSRQIQATKLDIEQRKQIIEDKEKYLHFLCEQLVETGEDCDFAFPLDPQTILLVERYRWDDEEPNGYAVTAQPLEYPFED